MKRFMYLSIGVLCLSLSVLIGFHLGHQGAQAGQKTVTAQKFVLVDPDGNERGEWVADDKHVAFEMRSSNPQSGLTFYAYPSDGPSFVMGSPGARVDIKAGTRGARMLFSSNDSTGAAQLELHNTTSKTSISLANRNKSTLEIIQNTTHGRRLPRVLLGNSDLLKMRQMGSISVVGDSATVTIP